MAQSQVKQMLKGSLDQMSGEISEELNRLDERLNALEERVHGQSSGNVGDSSNEPDNKSEERRDVFWEIMTTLRDIEREPQENFTTLSRKPPICVRCKHSMILDGSILQYTSGKEVPEYSYSGWIVCDQLPGPPFPARQAPTSQCMFHESDNGGEVKLPPKNP